ncbi:hypothetical protein H4R33_001258 [Dimargaris cristalligena]|nr:hypothetical protein H4R33_001258 [Dimargaris cristalligena]
MPIDDPTNQNDGTDTTSTATINTVSPIRLVTPESELNITPPATPTDSANAPAVPTIATIKPPRIVQNFVRFDSHF